MVEQMSWELFADPGVTRSLPQLGSGDPWMREEVKTEPEEVKIEPEEEAATPLVAEALELPEPIVGALSKNNGSPRRSRPQLHALGFRSTRLQKAAAKSRSRRS